MCSWKKRVKKKKEGNKHPLKSPFGSKGGKNHQTDISCGPTARQPPRSGQEPPSTPHCLFFFPTSCQEKVLRGNLLWPRAAFPPLRTRSGSPAILLAKTRSCLHARMTLSHPQHNQPCSHSLAPGPCLAGTSLTALFGEAHSPQFVET